MDILGGTRAIFRDEGLRGLYRGTSLALVGVGNGALQFVAYEKMKLWAFERRRRRLEKLGRAWTMDDDKLVRDRASSHTPPTSPKETT
jgi:solute carrier family 25 folate transporter 32